MTQVVGALARQAKLAFLLGNKALEQGRVKVAVKLLDRAFRMEPCVPTLHGYVMAALAAEDWQAARKSARLLTREDSANAESFFLLGAAYHGLGQWEKAAHAFQKCVSRNRNHIGAHQQLAQLAGFRGDHKAEMYHATAALTSPVANEIDRYWQSTLQLWLGDYANGWRNYEARHGLPLVIHGWRAPRGLDERKRWRGE